MRERESLNDPERKALTACFLQPDSSQTKQKSCGKNLPTIAEANAAAAELRASINKAHVAAEMES